jgi:hypothetical protein
MPYLSLTRDLLYLLSVVDKWLTDALPVADKRLTYVLSVVDKWLTDALPVADKRLTYLIPVADGDTEGDESTVSCQPALQAASQQRRVDITPADGQHHPCHRIFYISLKGQCHEMDKHFIQYFLCMPWWFSKSFHFPKQLFTFYLLLWNYLLIFKMLTETVLRIPFSVIGRCSLGPTSHWLQGKCARIILFPAAFGIILQNHRGLPVSIFSFKITALGLWSGILEGFFKISRQFQRSKLKLRVWFFHSSKKQKIAKTISACTKSIFLSKKLFISWHNPYKEATLLRIYNKVKTKCGKTKTRNDFDRSTGNVMRHPKRVSHARIIGETSITSAVSTKYRRKKKSLFLTYSPFEVDRKCRVVYEAGFQWCHNKTLSQFVVIDGKAQWNLQSAHRWICLYLR